MKKRLKKIAVTLGLIGALAFNVGGAQSAAAGYNVLSNVNQTKVIEKNKRAVYIAKQFAAHTPQRDDISFTKGFGYEWCARFAAYCVGDPDIVNNSERRDSCTVMRNYYRDVKKSYHSVDSGYVPKEGDLVFFEKNKNLNDGPEHVGIVSKVEKGRGVLGYEIETIEGNYKDESGNTISTSHVKEVPMDKVFYRGDSGTGIVGYATPYTSGEYFSYKCGDTDGNGVVNQLDSTYILKLCIGNYSIIPVRADGCMYFLRGDVSYDQNLEALDGTYLLRWLLNESVK